MTNNLHPEYQYLELLKNIKENGVEKNDRTGVGTVGIFGAQMKFDLADGFPLLTTKKTFLRGIIVELIWLIRGETNIKYLVDRDVHIWDEWPFQNYLKIEGLEKKFPKYSDEWYREKDNFISKIKSLPEIDQFVVEYGDLGPVYGFQWRNFNGQGVDQLKNAINEIKNNPTSRRIIVSAWNPAQIDKMLLPPCHMFYQFGVDVVNNRLDLEMFQRSADTFLGVPFNIASYSALLILIAKITGLQPGNFIHTFGDVHIYKNHFEQVDLQLSREPYPFSELKLKKEVSTLEDLEKLEWDDFELVNYISHPGIKASVAV